MQYKRNMKYYLILYQNNNGKVHGSQRDRVANNMHLLVYYEVPLGQREEVKHKFNNYTKKNQMILKRN